MAAPVLTANSPTAGKIAWTGFTISYGGQSYPISAGNMAEKFAYWKFSTATAGVAQALTLTNTLPSNLTDDDLVLFVNRNGVPISVQSANVVEGSIIATESIIGDSIAANTIDAVKLKADTITAREIAAGAITTSELSIASLGDGVLANGEFEEWDSTTGLPLSWIVGETAGSAVTVAQTASALSGAYAAQLTVPANSGKALWSNKLMPVRAGQKLNVGGVVSCGAAGGAFYLRVAFLQADGTTAVTSTPTISKQSVTNLTSGAAVTAASSTAVGYADIVSNWALPNADPHAVVGQIVVPTGAKYAQVKLYAWQSASAYTMSWDAFDARLTVTSTYIGDGEIQTTHLSATAIDGKTITGSTIRTSSTTGDGSASGQGVKVDTSGLKAYKASSATPVTTIDSATGKITSSDVELSGSIVVSGSLETVNTVGPSLTLGGGSSADGIFFYTPLGSYSYTFRKTVGTVRVLQSVDTNTYDPSNGNVNRMLLEVKDAYADPTNTPTKASITLYSKALNGSSPPRVDIIADDVQFNGKSMAKGIVAQATPVTANVTLGNAGAVVSLLSTPAFTYKADRLYRITGICSSVTSTVLGDDIILSLASGGGTQIMQTGRIRISTAGQAFPGGAVVAYYRPTSDANIQLVLRGQRVSGTGTATAQAGATFPMELVVEDVTPL